MRLTTVILLASLLQVSASTFGQRITINQKNVALESVLKEIRKQSGYGYYYGNDVIPEKQKINIAVTNASLEEALTTALQGLELRFEIEDKVIVIKQKEKSVFEKIVDRFQAIDVKGKIVDESGIPLVGATIKVRGTSIATTTDKNGEFQFNNLDANAILVITYLGYESKEIKAADDITIILKLATSELEEVTVSTGYWSTSKKLSTGNIGKISAKEIENQPISNPLMALQGRVAGLEVIQRNGVPGGNFAVRIRGTNSISNGNDPLYIINGVPYTSTSMAFDQTSGQILGGGTSPLNNINPSDIESIQVLKDADATAIYGSRGANGVILITTKKGKAGQTKVDFNIYSGIGEISSKQDLLSTQQYLSMRNEAFKNDKVTPSVANARDLLVWDQNRYTDWQKELIGGTANYFDAQTSVSGGNQNTQFLAGGGFHRETTVFPGDNSDQRASVNFSVNNTTPNQKLKTFFAVNYSINTSNLLAQDLTVKALQLPPNAPALYQGNGDLNWDGWIASENDPLENPVAYLKRRSESNTNTLIGNSTISYNIFRNIEVKAILGYTNTVVKAYYSRPISSLGTSDPAFVNNANFSDSKFQNWVIKPQVNWKPMVGKGQFDILVGSEFLSQQTEGLAQTATGFSSEALMKNITAAANISFGNNHYSQYRYAAVYGRVNYNLKDKYIINITARRDGSSRFGANKQFANFGAVGGAWIFSEEDFFKNTLSFLSFGKLRASYGSSGNDQLTPYQYLDAYAISRRSYNGVVGLTPARLSNANFAWEINKKAEGGLEFGLINNRIMAAFSYYRNRSSNQLVGQPLPPNTGFSSIQANFPATVQNTGTEIELNTRNIESTNFKWSSSINFSIPRNKLIAFPNLESFPAYDDLYVVGKPLNIKKLYRYIGIDPITGLYKVEDFDGNGSFNQTDRIALKNVAPDFFGGLQNSIQFKGFEFDMLFQFVKQKGRNYVTNFPTPGRMVNQPSITLRDSDFQRISQSFSASNAFGNFTESDQSVSDASFIRLKNVSLAWSLPKNFINRVKLINAQLFVRGQNLLTITNYKGLDPETQSPSLPPLKVFAAGINLSF